MHDDAVPGEVEASAAHYVYLYRDSHEKVRYIGYGKSTGRATSHLVHSHNDALNQFLEARDYRIEISGPYEDERTGRAVETALISAVNPDLNIDPGPSQWRFRPIGVPLQFADRQIEPELRLADFLCMQGEAPRPVLFVIVTGVNFEGDRIGYDPANPPSDDQIRSRVDRWWQLQRFLPSWIAAPEVSPGLLIGVYGSPGRQTVIASTQIDRTLWAKAEQIGGGRLRLPLFEPVDLDAFSLRGRRIARESCLKFGGIPAQFYILLGVDGSAVGGHHLRQ